MDKLIVLIEVQWSEEAARYRSRPSIKRQVKPPTALRPKEDNGPPSPPVTRRAASFGMMPKGGFSIDVGNARQG